MESSKTSNVLENSLKKTCEQIYEGNSSDHDISILALALTRTWEPLILCKMDIVMRSQ